MDSRTDQRLQGAAYQSNSEIEALIAKIKTKMPMTYEQIQRKAQLQGDRVFRLVRRGLRGEVNCFWAMEAGHVVGTPFEASHPVSSVMAQALVQFGCAHVCTIAEVVHGSH